MRNNIIIVLMMLGLTFLGTSVVLADLNNGLVAYYPFNGNANDESGNGNNGTVYGAALTSDRLGNANSAYSFDGVNDYIDVGPGFNLDAFTLDAWVFIDPAANIGERRVISKDNYNLSGDRKGFALKTSSPYISGKDGHPAFEVFIAPSHSIPMGDPHIDAIEASSAITAGWHHLAGVRNTAAGRFELYVDGLLVASKTPSVFGTIDSEVHTVIGQVRPIYNGEFFNGLIDEVRIYNRALSASEIEELYNYGGTPTAPTVTTKSATNVKSTSATLNGTVNANGGTTTAWFEYGNTSGTYSNTTSTQTISNGWSDTSVTVDISGLSSKTTYYYRLVAQNSVGTTYGSELSFATTAPPTVTTGSATNVTMISSTLNGTVNANGTSTTAWFEYGKASGAYDKTTTTQGVSGSSYTSVSIYVSGLSSGTGYYYRLVAQNNAGISYGSENSFTTITSSTPVPTPTATPTSTPTPTTLTDWITNPTNGHLYKLIDSGSWQGCEDNAVGLGGHLVTINDEDEQNWLVSTFGSNEEYGIGFTDKNEEGRWEWISGEEATYTNWASGEPNNCGNSEKSGNCEDEDYAVMNCSAPSCGAAGQWNDVPGCSKAIIEKNAYETNPTPTPQVSPSPVPEGVVLGFVYDEDEDPMRDVTVSIEGANYSDSTETDGEGYYEFTGLAKGDYALTYEKEGYTTENRDVSLEGDETVVYVDDIFMEVIPKGSIYGYVVDIRGDALEKVKLKLKGVKTKVTKTASSDRDGFFEFEDLDPDTYRVALTKKFYKKVNKVVKLEEGEDKEVEIEMKKRSKRIKGLLLEEDVQ